MCSWDDPRLERMDYMYGKVIQNYFLHLFLYKYEILSFFTQLLPYFQLLICTVMPVAYYLSINVRGLHLLEDALIEK